MARTASGEGELQSFDTNDRITLRYFDSGVHAGKEVLILLHGFTGSHRVWQRNIPAFSARYRVIAPDLRGHGESEKCEHGYHVSRLAMDLRELMVHLSLLESDRRVRVIGASLGCAILWSYSELFTPSSFSHMIFVDQSPLQNSTLDGWDSRFCNRGMNTPSSLAALQTTLALSPSTAHRGTIASCLGYRSHPLPTDAISPQTQAADEAFFLGEALKGDADWYGRLMADHTSLDWRDTVINFYNLGCEMETPEVLVVASSRSGCFPAAGPMKVVEYINGEPGEGKEGDGRKARGVVVDWGGHWCYWEDPERFDRLCLEFLDEE